VEIDMAIMMSSKEIEEGRRAGIPEYLLGKIIYGLDLSEREKEVVHSKGKVYVLGHKKYEGRTIVSPHLRDLHGGSNSLNPSGNLKEKVLTEEEKIEKLIEILDDKGYTDGTDVDTETALFEYGLIRNPKDDHVIYALVVDEEAKGFDTGWVSLDDAREYLEDVEEDFYSFIGSSKEEELKWLSNENVSSTINSANMYNGYFSGTLIYRKDIDDIIEMLE